MSPPAKLLRMVRPQLLLTVLGRLFPRSIRIDVVHPPVAIDVAEAQTVGDICAPRTWIRNRLSDPRPGRVGWIRFRIPEPVVPGVNDLRFAIAVNIFQ